MNAPRRSLPAEPPGVESLTADRLPSDQSSAPTAPLPTVPVETSGSRSPGDTPKANALNASGETLVLSTATAAEREELIDALLAEFIQAEEAGTPIPLEEFVTRHPEFADELREFLSDRSGFQQFTAAFVPGEQGDALPGPAELGTLANDPTAETMGGTGQTSRVIVPDHARQFGDYELLEELGRGGMGVVYKAHQQGLDRVVALKMLREGRFASSADRERFHREAQILSRLDHPNIVPVLDVGMLDGRDFFTMKWVDGGSLVQHLERLKVDHRAAAEVMIAAAHAVHYAHQRGILHRDIKPANVLLDAQHGVHVTDFGLSQLAEVDTGLTRSGDIIGTPRYMSPEQASGEAVLTVAADVYSLGAILFELLTGVPPHVGRTVREVLDSVISGHVSPPRQLNAEIDTDLQTICLRCLEREPERRYPSAKAFAEDLERWLSGEPIKARPSTRFERGLRWCGRHPLATGLLACALILFLLAPIAVFVVLNELERKLSATMLENNRYAAQHVSNAVLRKLHDLAETASELANDREMSEALERADYDALQQRIESLQRANADAYRQKHGPLADVPFKNLMVLDARGISRARGPARDAWVGREFGWRDYFSVAFHRSRAPLEGTDAYISHVYHSAIDHYYKFAISVPIKPLDPRKDEPLGVFVATITSAATLDLAVTDDRQHKAVLVGQFDRSSPPGNIDTAESNPFAVVLVHWLYDSPGVNAIPVKNEILREMLTSRPPVPLRESSTYFDPVSQDHWLASFASVPNTPLVVALQTPISDSREVSRVLTTRAGAWSLLLTSMCAVVLSVAVIYDGRRRKLLERSRLHKELTDSRAPDGVSALSSRREIPSSSQTL